MSYVGQYLSFMVVAGVDPESAREIALRPEVAMVEAAVPLKWLDIQRQAMRVQASPGVYSPATLADAYGWATSLDGTGVNIAILDSGVNDSHSELAGRYKFGYNAMIRKYENPAHTSMPGLPEGHGTEMARIALGSGDFGIAPGAGLVDIKIGDTNGANTADLVVALDKLIEHQKDWNIGVANLSLTYDLAPPYDKNDGNEAISWLVNRVVSSGIVVVAAAGNGPGQGDLEIKPPGTASLAITVGAADPGTTAKRDDDVINASTSGPRVDDGDLDQMDELKPEVAVPSCCGTSPASARASGLAALILQMAPGINPGSLKDLLVRTAENKGSPDTNVSYPGSSPTWNKAWGFGELDAYLAFQDLMGTQTGKTDLTFKGFDDSTHPSTPWYHSHAIETESERQNKNITAGVSDKIYVRIYNNGTQSSKPARVTFGFYDFSTGSRYFHDIGSMVIPPLPKGQDTVVTMDWTPPQLQGNQEHGCIRATIDYGQDSNFSNKSNEAQKNVQVKQPSSPVTFTFRMENPLSAEAVIELEVNQDERFADWDVSLTDLGGICARTIQARITPPAQIPPGTEALFFVSGRARERGTEEWLDISGVVLKVVVP